MRNSLLFGILSSLHAFVIRYFSPLKSTTFVTFVLIKKIILLLLNFLCINKHVFSIFVPNC